MMFGRVSYQFPKEIYSPETLTLNLPLHCLYNLAPLVGYVQHLALFHLGLPTSDWKQFQHSCKALLHSCRLVPHRVEQQVATEVFFKQKNTF